ncbi:hypothetical protein FOXYS1_15954, partial [Fusarium oxysporum]
MENDKDWNNWLDTDHPKLDGFQSGLVMILARRRGEPKLDPVKKKESDDWVKGIRKVLDDAGHASPGSLRGTGGQRNLRNLPFSSQMFKRIAKEFYIHDSIIRKVSRADVSDFSATKLEMEKQNGRSLSAHVYNIRTSNAWDRDVAVSATYFPHSNLTYAIMFGCTLSVEAEILTRLGKSTYEISHPLLIPSIVTELERKRHLPIVEEMIDQVEARILELNGDPESLQGVTEKEKIALKEQKRSAWLDMLYLRNQLLGWSSCLDMLYKHTNRLNRTTIRDRYAHITFRYENTEEVSDSDGSFSGFDSDLDDSIEEWTPTKSTEGNAGELEAEQLDGTELQRYSAQGYGPTRDSRFYMRRTGLKIRGRLQEIIKDYNEKIRECTSGIEGMVMATQWAQGETNVEIALATSQDSRHMRSIALVTMVFLPGTFFASIFSIGFFDFKGSNGSVVVSQLFWLYVVLAVGFTVLTVGAW